MTAQSDTATTEPPKRVLIILLGAIGDVVRALPLLGRLRRAWPHAHMAWAVEPKSKPLLERHSWLDQLIVYDRRKAPWAFIPFLREVRAGRFDLVVDLQRHLKSGVVAKASGASERLGFAAPNTKEFNHLFSTLRIAPQPNLRLKLMQYQAFADLIGAPPAPVEFGLELPADEKRRAVQLLEGAPRPLAGVILGSSWPSRIYFPEAVAAVARDLARPAPDGPALFPVLLGGADETGLATEVMRHLDPAAALNLAGRTGLRDLFAIFAECAVAFGPDSGPMHIAAAVGCPIVSLWGSTSPRRSAPWGYADLAIHSDIPCHPCYLRQCPIGRECMRRIAPQEVVAMVRRTLAARRRAEVDSASGAVTPRTAATIDRITNAIFVVGGERR
ncbi:MAG: glycosyltransferase family 9 protein [Candidatus Binataceae bacterium]